MEDNQDNDSKVELFMNNLSEEKRNHVKQVLQSTVNTLKENKANEDATFIVEITEKFDKVEPAEFIWMRVSISLLNNPLIIQTPEGNQHVKTVVKIIDGESYNIDTFGTWIDHVERIKKSPLLYMEKEGEVIENKFDNPMQDTILSIEREINDEIKNESTERDITDEELINEQSWFFSELFASAHPIKKTNEQYIKTFQKHMKLFCNRMMDTFLNQENENLGGAYHHLQNGFIMLTSDFEMCDFTSFKKEELETFGFTNWRNKILMIPLWAFPIVLKNNTGLILKDIHGDSYIVGTDYIDDENKGGNMIVGIPITYDNDEYTLSIVKYQRNDSI